VRKWEEGKNRERERRREREKEREREGERERRDEGGTYYNYTNLHTNLKSGEAKWWSWHPGEGRWNGTLERRCGGRSEALWLGEVAFSTQVRWQLLDYGDKLQFETVTPPY